MTSFSKLRLLLLTAGIAVVTTPRASATAELFLSDGNGHTASVTAISCGGSCETATFNGALGDWNINITTGTASPTESPIIDLNSIDHHNASRVPSTLTMAWSDNGFTPAVSGFQLNVGGTVGAHGTVTAALYGGTSNTMFDLSNQIGTTMTFTNPPISFSGMQNAYLSALSASPYALTEVATITFGTFAGQASFDYSVDTIPEPAGILLLGSALLVTATVVRRRRAQSVSPRA